MKILLVDDNLEVSEMLSRYLKLEGFEVTVSNDGKNGLNMIKSNSFDKILLDLSMPDFSGTDVLNSVKGNFDLKKIFIFSASSISKSDEEEMLKLGVHSVIRKPVSMPELVTILKS